MPNSVVPADESGCPISTAGIILLIRKISGVHLTGTSSGTTCQVFWDHFAKDNAAKGNRLVFMHPLERVGANPLQHTRYHHTTAFHEREHCPEA